MAAQRSVSILNESPTRIPSIDGHLKTAEEVSVEVQQILNRMKNEFISSDGKSVDYIGWKRSDLFTEYTDLIQELRSLDMTSLTEEGKTAFFINIYNALVIHGLCALEKLPESVMKVEPFWNTTGYNIGGHNFSLHDILHGVLRANRPHPSSKALPFEMSDPRLVFVIKSFDPRIHFAITFGAKSCPAFSVYSASSLDKQLSAATAHYLEDELSVYQVQRQVKVSRLFQWYWSDFGCNDVEAVRWCAAHVPGDKQYCLQLLLHQLETEGMVDIIYKEYFWNLNVYN
ncbi:hypothetical protein NP493_262g03022 [Ridgeia piscesae]|uniref:DUF547 domain-containing protein n=1 Tax=Ridgeia piscesae TaxID=27915 RepID=A0AAD9UCQ1_RIDPI|nr:hypothetical protein NP493_262g03022 [Ridgeia piscesae]